MYLKADPLADQADGAAARVQDSGDRTAARRVRAANRGVCGAPAAFAHLRHLLTYGICALTAFARLPHLLTFARLRLTCLRTYGVCLRYLCPLAMFLKTVL